MLRMVRSPVPGLVHEPGVLPMELAGWLERLDKQPRRFLWIVPTSRRRRALLRHSVGGSNRQAALLPRIHTLESFVAQALAFSCRQRPRLSGPERLLRLARAWFEVTSRPPGPSLVRQLDRFVRDWQATLWGRIPTHDTFEQVVQRFQADLAADNRLDRMSSLALLIEELADPDSGPQRFFFKGIQDILFDGFHRLEPIELDLIAGLSRRHDVTLWLVGTPGSATWSNLQFAADYLRKAGTKPGLVDHVPKRAGSLAALGRKLFPLEAPSITQPEWVAELFKLEEAGPLEEVEATARCIKRDYLAAQRASQRQRDVSFRLSDVAVVIPGPAYDPLIREVFPRAGLEFNLAGRALQVAQSRPARVLTAALDLIQGQWRHDLLLDFLNLPLVKRRLDDGHRLHDLFDHRPRARKRLDFAAWQASWQGLLTRLRTQLARWISGDDPLPERVRLSRAEFLARQTEQADGFQRLIGTIVTILQPVSAIEKLTESPPDKGPLRELVQRLADLLRTLQIEKWLTPPMPDQSDLPIEPVPWVEYEKDQQAYFKMLGVLKTLAATPDSRLPLQDSGRPDLRSALRLALDGESYQIKTEDDAGVQVVEIREIRGMAFRHVYVLGLVDGQIPALPEEGLLAARRRDCHELLQQLEHKENEAKYLFVQLFEAARDKLVLSRWIYDEDRQAVPSPFLAQVEAIAVLPLADRTNLVGSVGEAAARLGLRMAGPASDDPPLSSVWPAAFRSDKQLACRNLHGAEARTLEHLQQAVRAWKNRPAASGLVRVELPLLLEKLFPDERAFSPSDLEDYAACPFRYFGKRALRLEEREADDTLSAHGSLVHRVLNRFYAERRRAAGDPDRPLPPVGPKDRPLLLRIYRQEWDQQPEGFLSPELLTVFERRAGLLDFFMELMQKIEGEGRLGNLWTELPLAKVPLGTDTEGRPVFLAGTIDRVDAFNPEPTATAAAAANGARANGARANGARDVVVVDYKTGKIVDRKDLAVKLDDGRMLQLPLYGAALEVQQKGLKAVGGIYLHLSSHKKSNEKAAASAIVQVGREDGKDAEAAFDTKKALDLAVDFAGRIRAGEFSLTKFSNGKKLCECTPWCPLRHACRHPDGYELQRW